MVIQMPSPVIASASGTSTADLAGRSFWATTSPEERAAVFRRWATSHEGGPNLPDEALSRESIYD